MIQNPTMPTLAPLPPAEYNAIKININGAQVTAPQQYPVQAVPAQQLPPAPEAVGTNVDYNA